MNILINQIHDSTMVVSRIMNGNNSVSDSVVITLIIMGGLTLCILILSIFTTFFDRK